MKKLLLVFTIIVCALSFSITIQAQSDDRIAGYDPIVVPDHIQTILQQIKLAEDNEDWEAYSNLRQQLITAWEEVNPEVAAIYKRSTTTESGSNYPDAPKVIENFQSSINIESLWGEDLMVHAGDSEDISLVSARGDTLYLGVLDRHFGSSDDTVYIYRSADAGDTWSLFSQLFYPAETDQIELLDFWGGAGPSYLLLFSKYISSGRVWVTRFSPSGTFENFIGINENCVDFAVDRNYPTQNYRAIILYDSSGVIRSIRSEPSSYASVWQDSHVLGLLGVDVDFAYGLNGSVFTSFNGGNSGNLYVWPNYNYADPSSWISNGYETLVQGAVDTTKQSEVIASREDTSAQTVAVVFTHDVNNTEDLRWARKTGGAGWSMHTGWVVNNTLDFKHSNLYCAKTANNDNFQGVFARSELGNLSPRHIRYKKYDGSSWSLSTQISDDGNNATGVQNPVVVEVPSGNAAFAFAGNNGLNVYFDREDWVTDVQSANNKVPDTYSLSQNYPNPFNPSTTIKYSVPDLSFVNLKIYNLIGQELVELVNEELQRGNYEVTFDAVNLPSGVYFYRLQAGNFVETKKMLLMK
jgi:hypothetical protein